MTSYEENFISFFQLKKNFNKKAKAKKPEDNIIYTLKGKLNLMFNIAATVSQLHSKKYSHNNLSCWTILVNLDDGDVRVTGLSCLTPFGQTNKIRGNEHFMSDKTLAIVKN